MSKITKIAIQGGKASFHDMAARQYFADAQVDICECRTFREQIQQLLAGDVDRVVMAIENTLAGSILPNYALLQSSPTHIIGEVYLRIEQNLMALPGQKLTDIRNVKSHPMALHQCSEFLESHPEIVSNESHDTADSAREIKEQNQKGVAAIAGSLAAEIYDLEILAKSIENIHQNYTRFLVVATRPEQDATASANKASLCFHTMHKVGALAQVMNVFRDNGLNLALIQSTPIPGQPDEYAFHVDIEWLERPDYDEALHDLKKVTRELKVLGEYKSGNKPYAHSTS